MQQSIQLSVVHTVPVVVRSVCAMARGAALACAVQPRLDRADVRARSRKARSSLPYRRDHRLALAAARARRPADHVADVRLEGDRGFATKASWWTGLEINILIASV